MISTDTLTEIRRTIDLFLKPGEVLELRMKLKTSKGMISGYFNDAAKMEAIVARYDGIAEGIYFTPNPTLPALLARAYNKTGTEQSTSDKDIVQRRWFLIDFDPVRPAGISSSDEEHNLAIDRARLCVAWLKAQGWPDAILGDSGNGAHVVVAIDLPNDDESRDLIKHCLEALNFLLGDDKVKVDLTPHNAARIWKFYGTMARKGENLPERPHRQSKLLEVPENLITVKRKLLKTLAALLPKVEKSKHSRDKGSSLNIGKWIEEHKLPVTSSFEWNGGFMWILNPCPWNPEHTNDSAFIVKLPNGAISARCHHDSCSDKKWHDLRALYEEPDLKSEDFSAGNNGSSTPCLPQIEIRPGELPAMVDEIEQVLIDNHDQVQIYQRGGMLIKPSTLPVSGEDNGIKRPAGALLLRPILKAPYLLDVFNRQAEWGMLVRNNFDRRDCPAMVAQMYLDRAGEWRLPELTGVIEAPTLRPDGSILDQPGYDPITGLIFHTKENWGKIPENPRHDEALRAIDTLKNPLREFPFVDVADMSVALAAILTSLIRRKLPTAPLFAFTSPTAGTGKGLLADIISLIATGRTAPAMPQGGGNNEEMRKRITSVLLSGDPIVNIDNVEYALSGDALCSVLTQEYFQDRILGTNKIVHLPTNVLWMATGNNITFLGDMVRRGLQCRLDAHVERPDQRNFKVENLRIFVLSMRQELVVAALTVLRAYEVAGRPKQKIVPFGSFEAWSDRIRSPLIWLGLADPCNTRDRIIEEDPDRENLQIVLEAIHTALQDRKFTVKGLADLVKEPGADINLLALQSALMQVASKDSQLNPQKLGTWLQKHKERPMAGLVVVRLPEKREGAALWQLVKLAGQPSSVVQSGGLEGDGGLFQPIINRDSVINEAKKVPAVPQVPPAVKAETPASALDTLLSKA